MSATLGENNTSHTQIIKKLAISIREEVARVFATVEHQIHDATLTARKKVVDLLSQNWETTVKSTNRLSRLRTNSVAQNPEQRDFPGNMEDTPLMTATKRIAININNDTNDETRKSEKAEDGNFQVFQSNCNAHLSQQGWFDIVKSFQCPKYYGLEITRKITMTLPKCTQGKLSLLIIFFTINIQWLCMFLELIVSQNDLKPNFLSKKSEFFSPNHFFPDFVLLLRPAKAFACLKYKLKDSQKTVEQHIGSDESLYFLLRCFHAKFLRKKKQKLLFFGNN